MILVVGALGSGRAAFARGLAGPGACVREAEPGQRALGVPACDVLLDAQELALPSDCVGGVADEAALGALADVLAHGAGVVTMAEVGCGVVPGAPEARAWREAAGRLGCALAARAACVVRMTCGLPSVIKGSLHACGVRGATGAAPGAVGTTPRVGGTKGGSPC